MEILELKVQVEKSQLAQLDAEITRLKSQTIKLTVDASGIKSMGTTLNNVSSSAQKLTTSVEKTGSTTRTFTTEAGKASTTVKTYAEGMTKAGTATKTYSEGTAKASAGTKTFVENATKASKSASLFGDSIGNVALKMAAWQVMGDLVATPIRAIKEALSAMKEVDDQLVDVRKVTDFTESQMKALEEQAYSTASAYGVAADQYLESVAAFARAGYQEQSEALAELSTKTQIVGNTNAETANQFLLAVDAAYQYKGSVEKLGVVLDGVNEIDNKYATSIENIAEGLGKVAPISAQAHVGIDELSAALGTITAVTQRSGTEAATALRALFLNIMGDTKTEIDEGVTWTTGEIAGLRDVLNIYASDVVAAADATGSLINPMEAIGALSQSMKDGVLTEQKLMEMVSDIGGKLRSSQLLALIQNWDMYESMLADYGNAIGSADREVENAMDSWTRKTETLKNTWTEFVSHMVETDAIKGALDGVTGTIEVLDSDLGQTAIKIGTVTGAVGLLGKGVSALKGVATEKVGAMAFGPIAEGATTAGLAAKTLLASINPVTAAVIAVAAAAVAIPAIVDAVTVSYEEQIEKVQELQTQYSELTAAGGEYATLQEKLEAGGTLTSQEEKRLAILKAQVSTIEQRFKLEQEEAARKWQSEYGQETIVTGSYREGDRTETTRDVQILEATAKAQRELNAAFLDGQMGEADYRSGLEQIISDSKDYYEGLLSVKDAGVELSDAQNDFISTYDAMLDKVSGTEDGMMQARLALEEFQQAYKVTKDSMIENGFEGTVINVDALRDQMEEAGVVAEEIQEIIDNLNADNTILTFSVEGDVEDAIASLEELGIAIKDADGQTITIDYEQFMEFGQDIGYTQQDLIRFLGSAESIGNINFSNARGEIVSLKDAFLGFDGINMNAPMQALQNAANEAQQTKGKVDELDQTDANPEITVSGAELAESKAKAVANALGEIPQSVPVTISVKQTGTIPTFGVNAEGNRNFEGGTTLLGDEKSLDGAPRPELVVANGKAFLAGTQGPEIHRLPRGAQIFNNRETEQILSRSARGNEEIPAFSTGTTTSVNLWKYYGASGSSTANSESSGTNHSAQNVGTATVKSASQTTSSGKSSGGNGSSSSSKDTRQEELEDQVKLLESELDLMEAQGRPAAELAAKMREIQGALNAQAEYMRSIGADQTEINKLSTEWWTVREDITKAYREEMQDERDLLESQLELMENQGRPVQDRISKLEEIQDSLHKEADFLREIGAEQEEINKLSNEWWDTQSEILKIQEDLWDELDEAVSKELERAKEARDEEIDALDKQLEAMKAAREEKEEQLTLEEKILAVQEAQEALANAQNERTIRTYNAATGQWEWVADQSAVKDAEEALEDAQKDLDDYREDLAYEAAVAEIEARKDAINEAYDTLEASWDSIVESIQEPTRDISEILKDIAENGTPLMKEQVETTGRLLGDLNNYISAAVGSKTGDSYVGGGGTSSKNYSNDTTDYSALMDQASSEAEFNYWSQQRTNKMEAQGIDTSAEGWRSNAEIYEAWKTKNGIASSGQSSSSGGGSSSKESSSNKASSGISSAVSSLASAITSKAAKSSSEKLYDGGGVLEGLGGIKATAADEMVLPPDITAAMLAPSADSTFQARVKELGLLYGGNLGRGIPTAGMVQNRSSQDHYGDSYQFGDVTLTESQAKSMTVYDLAQMSRNLSLYGWR